MVVAVSFDLFGTLVAADRPGEPWVAVADALGERGVAVPEAWEEAYRSSHVPVERGAELSLVDHVEAALASRGVDADRGTVEEALLAAFDGPVTVREGAAEALRAARTAGPVGVLSNCSLPGLADRALERAALPVGFDAVVTSVSCGWRKPYDRAFEAVAGTLGVPAGELVHVGDDPRADGGGRTAGVTVVLTGDVPLSSFPDWLEGRECG
jgi:FMN phosphatase YigB (HAD superfamily)